MKMVDRLVLRDLIGPLINSVLMFLMVLFAATYLFSLTELLASGIPLLTVGRIALYGVPMLMTQTLPMGMLLASLLTLGRLSGDSEHIALFAGGISFYRMVRPLAWVGLLVSVIAFVWDEVVVPPATRAFLSLKREVTEGLVTTGKPLTYNVMKDDHVDEFVTIDGGYDPKARLFRKVTILKMSDDPDRRGKADFYIEAERARPNSGDPKGLDWYYEGVRPVDLRPHAKYMVDTVIASMTTRSLKSTLGADVGMGKSFTGVLQAQKRDNRSMTFQELRDKIREERANGKQEAQDIGADEVDLWGKISTPLASLVFGLVGAPLGIRPQRGSKAMGFGVAIGIIFLYWVAYNWLYQLGKGGALPPLAASFAPNVIGVIAAILLISRTRQ